MQGNEFEKEMRQKLDELKFNPSGEVWENVAAAIAKRKKDRRVFLIIFLCLLIIGTGIFMQFSSTFNKKNNVLVSDKNNPVKDKDAKEFIDNNYNKKNAIAAKKGKSVSEKSDSNIIIIAPDNLVTKKIPDSQNAGSVHRPITKAATGKKHGDNNSKIDFSEDDRQNVVNQKNYKTKQRVSTIITNSEPVNLVNNTTLPGDTVKSISGSSVPLINDVALQMEITDSLTKNKISVANPLNDTIVIGPPSFYKVDTSLSKEKQVKQKDGWKLGFNFSIGVSTTKNGLLGIIGSGSDEAKAYVPANQSTGGGIGQPNNAVYYPSTVKPGTGVVVGAFAQKNISLKAKILIGLNYKTYSSVMMVGNRIDSSNYLSQDNYFYTNGTNTSYKNKFHFIELPVAFQFKLSKEKKLPIYLNTGISIAQLIGSTALQFDAATGKYYKDNTMLNKTQFNISAGVLFSISGQAKNPLLIGPDINYSLNKIANSGLFNDHHYSYVGILIQKTIGKK